ncbi:hypothetical protein [Phyllobacterium phragmitis]|uniref:Uncharacterized protein n=1 Tax=Phyllobacterium phragmitis TaxID=2670329 RepID=A0ABQ0H752_9HYPH
MTATNLIATTVASLGILASIGPALAARNYCGGVDIKTKNGASSGVKKTDRRATAGIRTNAATYGFLSTAKSVPTVIKDGEGEYCQSIIGR